MRPTQYQKTGLDTSDPAAYSRAYYRLRKLPGPDRRFRTDDPRVTRWASNLLGNLKKSAKTRGIPWAADVNAAWLHERFDRQRGRCFYTGVPFVIDAVKRGMRRPSLDRIDTSGGYTRENTVLCLVAVNYAKNDYDAEEFCELLEAIRHYRP